MTGKINLRRMSDEANPGYRLKLAREARKRGDIAEYAKQLRRAAIEQSEFIRYSGKQKLEYAIKEATNKFGSNWQSGAKDIINKGRSIVNDLRSKFGF